MLNSPVPDDRDRAPGEARATEAERVDRIVRRGPHGAIAVAGIATLIVIGIWYAFYFFVFLPRGTLY
jgi:hypothetical protein